MARLTKTLLVLFVGAWFPLLGAEQSDKQAPVGLSDDPIRIADLGLENEIPSAIDLVGPEDGSAGRNRTALLRRMQCWIDGVESCSVADLNDPRVRAMRRFLGQRAAGRDGAISVHFPDGTRIMVRLARLSDLDPNDWDQRVYKTVVLPRTVQAPGLPAVPSRPGHFDNFAYEGKPAIHDALERLQQRFQ